MNEVGHVEGVKGGGAGVIHGGGGLVTKLFLPAWCFITQINNNLKNDCNFVTCLIAELPRFSTRVEDAAKRAHVRPREEAAGAAG